MNFEELLAAANMCRLSYGGAKALEEGGWTVLKEVEVGCTQAYLVDKEGLTTWVFPGTAERMDMLRDLETWRERDEEAGGIETHAGFLRSWNDIRDAVLNSDVEARAFAGHSLGGALAQVAARHSCWSGKLNRTVTPEVVTFGAPRVFAGGATSHVLETKHLRVANVLDVVPRLPPRILGYSHLCAERVVMEDDGKAYVGLSNWEERVLRMKERFENFMNGKIDALHDHSMDVYVKRLEMQV